MISCPPRPYEGTSQRNDPRSSRGFVAIGEHKECSFCSIYADILLFSSR